MDNQGGVDGCNQSLRIVRVSASTCTVPHVTTILFLRRSLNKDSLQDEQEAISAVLRTMVGWHKERLFPLFVVVDVDNKTINETLSAAGGPKSGYGLQYWLATNNYSDAGPNKGERYNSDNCTQPPISDNFKSPWICCKYEDIGPWLQAKPESAGFNPRYFAVLDAGVRDDPPTTVVCIIGDWLGEGEKVFSFRFDRIRAVDHLAGAPNNVWDELTRYGHGDGNIKHGGAE